MRETNLFLEQTELKVLARPRLSETRPDFRSEAGWACLADPLTWLIGWTGPFAPPEMKCTSRSEFILLFRGQTFSQTRAFGFVLAQSEASPSPVTPAFEHLL